MFHHRRVWRWLEQRLSPHYCQQQRRQHRARCAAPVVGWFLSTGTLQL